MGAPAVSPSRLRFPPAPPELQAQRRPQPRGEVIWKMPLEAPVRSLGPACGVWWRPLSPPGERAVKLRGGRGAPGAPGLVLGPAGRRRQGRVEEGVIASSTSSAFVPRLPFWCRERKVRARKPSGRKNRSTTCPRMSLAEADPSDPRTLGFYFETWLDPDEFFPVNLSVDTLWHLGLPVTFWGGARAEEKLNFKST